jgi:cell division protein FtsI/penicillin-binding protein 2
MSAETLTRAPARMRLAMLMLAAVGLVLAARLFYWQIVQWDRLDDLARGQLELKTKIYARRGDIRTRDGYLLAADRFLYTARLTSKVNRKSDTLIQIARELGAILNQPPETILPKLSSKEVITLARDVPITIGGPLQDLKEKWYLTNLEITSRPMRYYPGGSFATHVVGYVNLERQAAYGVEQARDTLLRGRDGQINAAGDALREVIPFDVPMSAVATNGADLVLTIDSGMQRVVEMELANAIRNTRAASGSILVLDPKTGAILALAAYPTADLNAYFDPANQSRYNNQVVSAQYEPGSVFKAITLASALDAGTITPHTVFDDPGQIEFGGATIKNPEERVMGRVGLVDVMRYSLNVIALKMSVGLGAEKFYQYVRDFGFGNLTRVELAAEVAGEVKSPGDGKWRDIDLGTNSFGQGIAATPLQVASAIAAIANQGKLMKPYIIHQIHQPGANPVTTAPQFVRQVIKPDTARLVTQILADAIVAESTHKAVVPGYRIAGKTGTAQISSFGAYDQKWTIASFVGYLPADDPRFVILVKLDKPQTSEWGSQVASPVFAAVAKQLVAQIGLPPDEIRKGK